MDNKKQVSSLPGSLPKDLRITSQRFSTVYPLEETKTKCMFLSNIDQVLNFNLETVHFFTKNPDFSPETVASILENAFRKVLVHYDFLAGRLRFNDHARLEINCNSAGAGFAVASSEMTLAEIGDLVYPNPAFQQLVMRKYSTTGSLEEKQLCAIQVTSFKCGGFALGVLWNHAVLDGIGLKMFLDNLASVAADEPLVKPPYNCRQLLAVRSPPRVTFSHPEFVKFGPTPPPKLPVEDQESTESTTGNCMFEATLEPLDLKVFRLSEEDIIKLKNKAKLGGNINSERVTTFNVVTAHIWRCKAIASSSEDKTKMSTILYAVDIRPRMVPPLPPTYSGNAVLSAYATASISALEEESFTNLVQMVSEGSVRLTDEYARSVIDWGELNKGFPKGDILVSSWWKLGFSEVEYPWGSPIYSCPVVSSRKDIVLLFPEYNQRNGATNNYGHGVMNVLVALGHEDMEEFQKLFYKFLL